jgi:hypothetical protein
MHQSTPADRALRLAGPLAAVLALGFAASPAQAYLGPGSGLTALGSIIALLGVIGLGIVGFLWYPVKRLLKRIRGASDREPPADGETEQ